MEHLLSQIFVLRFVGMVGSLMRGRTQLIATMEILSQEMVVAQLVRWNWATTVKVVAQLKRISAKKFVETGLE